MNKKAQTIGDGHATAFTVSHGFGTKDVTVSVWNLATGDDEFAGVSRPDDDSVVISFAEPPAKESYRVVVIG